MINILTIETIPYDFFIDLLRCVRLYDKYNYIIHLYDIYCKEDSSYDLNGVISEMCSEFKDLVHTLYKNYDIHMIEIKRLNGDTLVSVLETFPKDKYYMFSLPHLLKEILYKHITKNVDALFIFIAKDYYNLYKNGGYDALFTYIELTDLV